MAPLLSDGVHIAGASAYRDDSDGNQFHYIPRKVFTVPGETLQNFRCTYWGFGKKYLVQENDGSIRSRIGAIMSGLATADLTRAQRAALLEEIAQKYPGTNPRLLPLRMTEVTVEPMLAENVLGIKEGGDQDFPSTLTLGGQVPFVVGSGNSLFVDFVANRVTSDRVTPNSAFMIFAKGKVEYVGDPWEVHVEADLSQVWSYVRKTFGTSAKIGWFRIGGANYERIMQDLRRDNVVKMTFKEGSLDNEKFGRQIFEMGKEIFTAINNNASGEAYFKFEPNPNPGGGSELLGGLGNLLPWSVSVNGSYTHQSYEQSIHFERDIRYTGRLKVEENIVVSLGVGCNSATRQFFRELGFESEPCITQSKSDAFQNRLEAEQQLRQQQVMRLLSSGISLPEYREALKLLNTLSLSEDAISLEAPIGFDEHTGAETVRALGEAAYGSISEADFIAMQQELLGS